ncbi:MAG: hypothetical protein A4E56_00156 [Pelotomaculum sp. PtaU1.Bin065]|nr:MAG: hypothetical protein A4E56_00156 [Pelotomaculum sp. PtaU1.Bin065]
MKKLSGQDLDREIGNGMKLDAEGCRLLIKKLESVNKTLEARVEREKSKRAERASAISEYKTEADIQDAYGYDLITDDERRQLLEQLETGEKYVEDTETRASVALTLLRGFIGKLSREAASLEFELLPPEEQAKRLKASEKFRERVQKRRNQKGEK